VSDRRLRVAAFVLTLAGIGVAAYLTYVHYAGLQPFCAGGSHGCERVQSSSYASVGGLPVALLGLAGYVAIAAALVAPGERARVAATALAVTGFGFLTYLELFVIDAICQWCVASAVILTLLTVVTVWRLLVDDDPMA
jgi:uncharacterized membrane protein